MTIFLITVEGASHHPQFLKIFNNVSGLGVRTGGSAFLRQGIVRSDETLEEVHRAVTKGVRKKKDVTVREIGPVTVESDIEHVHWRITAHDFLHIELPPDELKIINEHQRAEI